MMHVARMREEVTGSGYKKNKDGKRFEDANI